MGWFAIRRIGQALFVLVPASFLIFIMLQAAPGDAARYLAGPDAPAAIVAAVRHEMGLDRPIFMQYGIWLSHVARGDLGNSYISGVPVRELIVTRGRATFELAAAAAVVALLYGITWGLVGARFAGRTTDWLVSAINSLIFATPTFWLAILGILLFGLKLGVLPIGGAVPFTEDPMAALQHLVLPAVALGLPTGAVLARFVRTSVLEELDQDYIRASRARGASERYVLLRHAFRNALVPITTVFGVQLATMLGGAVIVETVFSWPGLGVQTVDAIDGRDYPVVQGTLLILLVIAVLVNLIVDLTYVYLDPRIRVGARSA